MRVMTAAGPPMTWTRLSGPSGSLPCLPARLRMATVIESGDHRGGADAGHERAGGALLEQFGSDEAVHDDGSFGGGECEEDVLEVRLLEAHLVDDEPDGADDPAHGFGGGAGGGDLVGSGDAWRRCRVWSSSDPEAVGVGGADDDGASGTWR